MSGRTRTVFLDGFNPTELSDGTEGVLLVTAEEEGLEVQNCPVDSLVTWRGQEYVRILDKRKNIIPDEELLTYQRHF